MPAYVIGHIIVKNPEKWSEYQARIPATLEPWGARLLCRGKLAAVLAGEHDYTDTVVIQFPDQNAVHGWHESPAYQALLPTRQQAADVLLLSYDG